MEMGQVSEWWLCKNSSKTFTDYYKVLSRNIYRKIKENYDKPRRSYSITRPNRKPSTSKIQIYGITAGFGRQADNIP